MRVSFFLITYLPIVSIAHMHKTLKHRKWSIKNINEAEWEYLTYLMEMDAPKYLNASLRQERIRLSEYATMKLFALFMHRRATDMGKLNIDLQAKSIQELINDSDSISLREISEKSRLTLQLFFYYLWVSRSPRTRRPGCR
jgi:hypothetical protein